MRYDVSEHEQPVYVQAIGRPLIRPLQRLLAVSGIDMGTRADADGSPPGRSERKSAVSVEIAAITSRSVVNPDAFTAGPSRYTASELTPNDTVSRMPATRERSRSSTYCTIIASMNGIAPKTKIMNASAQANSAQPVACAASTKRGTWAATMGR